MPGLPVVHYPKLLELALCLDSDELGIEMNKIDASGT